MIFNIKHDDQQGVIMRVLNAVSRRGLEFWYIHADNGKICLHTNSDQKQAEQLMRDWNATVGVHEVTQVRDGR